MTSVNGAPSFGGIRDVCDSVDRAEKGASLTLRELLDVADLLYVSAGLIAYSGSKNVSCGTLGEIFDRIFKNPTLEKEIKRVIITEDTISDDATPQLAAIRKNIRNTIHQTSHIYVSNGNCISCNRFILKVWSKVSKLKLHII